MSKRSRLHTVLCELLGCEYPIMLAGMGGTTRVTTPELVAAVSNAGGFGVLGAISRDPENIRQCVGQIRQLTDRPFGIDIAVPASLAESGPTWEATERRIASEYPRHVAFVQELIVKFGLPTVQPKPGLIFGSRAGDQVKAVLEERVPLLAVALGDPTWVVPLAHEVGTRVLGMAGSVPNALRQKQAGVDIIVAQGSEAGGHTGRISTFPLLPAVVDAVAPTPVVAAGGIADGRGLVAALALGAVGAWVGSAFLAAEESGVPPAHWEQIAGGTAEDFTLSRAYTGKPSRGYRNVVKEAWESSALGPLPMPLQSVLMKPLVDAAIEAGRWDLVLNPAGQVAGSIKERRPARQIFEQMVAEAEKVLDAHSHPLTGDQRH
ncbi:MAG: nitronate monooxygenase [Chloroflexi bacterium]|nr:nitronate monooxygenase [Chloroflexota bacterium]